MPVKFNDAIFGAVLLVLRIAVLVHVQSFPRIPGQNVGRACSRAWWPAVSCVVRWPLILSA